MAGKLVWEVPLSCWPLSLEPTQATLTVTGSGSTPYDSATQALVGWADLETTEDESIWVERIIGHSVSYLTNAAVVPQPRYMMERIHVGFTAIQNTAEVAFYQSDLYDHEGAEEPFMWQRQRTVAAAQENGGSLSNPYNVQDMAADLSYSAHPFWSQIDIRVGRMLRPPRTLGLTVQTPLEVGDSLRYFAWLRMLVRR